MIQGVDKEFYCWVCGSKAEQLCGGCEAAVYCGEKCQNADWKKHQEKCEILSFVCRKFLKWINAPIGVMWRGTKQIQSDSILLIVQRSIREHMTKGVTLQVIEVADNLRRKGLATDVLRLIENVCKQRDLDFVLVQSIQSDIMLNLVKKRGYKKSPYSEDYVLKLK
jgi:ribosomal protein S18 acetylase RimI-like enzyme